MSRIHDVAVIGAGPNGLTAATLLARAGRKVILLERRSALGGLAASEEFHPGFRSAGLFHDSGGVSASVIRRLGLERHGLRRGALRPELLALASDGRGLVLGGSAASTATEIAVHSTKDAERYSAYREFVERVRSVLTSWLDEPPPDLFEDSWREKRRLVQRALRLRLLGRKGMTDLLRLPPMPVADWLDEWFETDTLKAALALPAVTDTFAGPRSPGTTANLLLWEAAAQGSVEGGGAALVAALESAARDQGVEIRLGQPVERLLLGSSSVTGLILAGGERIDVPVVAASCDPKELFLRLVPPGTLSARLERDVRAFRSRGTLAQLLLAVRGQVEFACRPGRAFEFARTAHGLDAIERAFDAVKYGRAAEHPVLDLQVPTLNARHLAPAGHEVISVRVHCVPHHPDPVWNDERRERLADAVVAGLEPHLPGLTTRILGRRLLLPRDIEDRYACSGGHPCHGEHSLDQMLVRPAPGCPHRTPIPGLYLCGSGSHPGGGLTCRPGALSAAAILRAGA